MSPPPIPPQVYTYFFKSSVKLSPAHMAEMITELNVSDPLPNPPSRQIGDRHWHVYVFQLGADKVGHHGKEFLLQDNTQVQLSVSELATEALQTISKNKHAVDFLASLKTLPENEVAQLHSVIKDFLIEGHFAITERAAQIQYIKEELVKYGITDFVMVKKIVLRFGSELVDALAQLGDDENKKVLEGFILTVISVGISVNSIVNSIRAIVNTQQQFKRQVKQYLQPILHTLRQLHGYTNSVVELLEKFVATQDVAILEAIPSTVDLAAGVVSVLLKKIPTIEKSIEDFVQAKQNTQAEKKKQAWAALLLSLLSVFSAGTGLFKLAKEGAKAFSALEKLYLTLDTTRFAVYAAEFGTATFAYYDITDCLEEAQKHLEFYSTIRNTLNEETAKGRDDKLRSLFDDGARNVYIFMPLLDQYKIQSKELKSLIEMGEKL